MRASEPRATAGGAEGDAVRVAGKEEEQAEGFRAAAGGSGDPSWLSRKEVKEEYQKDPAVEPTLEGEKDPAEKLALGGEKESGA